MAVLKVEGLEKSFGKTQVLRGIGFALEKGEVLSIIGSSGSGKTTLLRCLNFLETADRGRIEVNGETLFDAGQNAGSAADIRRKRLHFGLVFQSFNLFPQYTALENVTLAMDLHTKEAAKQEKRRAAKAELQANRARAKELLARVGLENKMDHYPCQLSGGQQQRVAIARALALEPDILCFDEPTSALDPETTNEVIATIQKLVARRTTMLIVTHDMRFARESASRVLFMDEGKILEENTPQALFDRPQNPRLQAFLRSVR